MNYWFPYYKAFDAGANVFAGYEMAAGAVCTAECTVGLNQRLTPKIKE
jgi:hypothetical protein